MVFFLERFYSWEIFRIISGLADDNPSALPEGAPYFHDLQVEAVTRTDYLLPVNAVEACRSGPWSDATHRVDRTDPSSPAESGKR
jgi:hypothetical protein